MEIVVKHKDILTGYFSNTPVNEYLIYLVDDNKNSLECKIAYGDDERDSKVLEYKNNNGSLKVREVSLESFKTATKENKQTY